MIVLRRILEKDCATVCVTDFFDYDEEGGHSIEDYDEEDIMASMMQLAKMGVGEVLSYSVWEVERFVMNDKEFRLLRKSKQAREKLLFESEILGV